MTALLSWDTPLKIFRLIGVVTMVGGVIFLTYASISAILYLVVQDMFLGTKAGDKIESFTGLEGSRNKSGIQKVITRFSISLFIMSLLVTNGHVKLLSLLYQFVIDLFGAGGL